MRADRFVPTPALECGVAVTSSGDRALTGGAAARSMRKLCAYAELTKPRITLLIVMVAVAAFWLGSKGAPDLRMLFNAVVGVSLLAAGVFALNQYTERDLDARMRRTENRPVPAHRLRPVEALGFGAATGLFSVVWLVWAVNLLSGCLALFTLASYLLLYTPSKTRTPHSTLLGAFPGATPPLFGWAAARGDLGLEAGILFAILFLWQFAHFHAIAWVHREDYARAAICMWPVIEPEGRTTIRQIVGFTGLLFPASLLPGLLGVAGPVYLCGAALLGIWLLYRSLSMALNRTSNQARRLFLASVIYLPVLFGLMVLDGR